jgi:hypothetical protein
MEFTTHLELQSQATRLFESELYCLIRICSCPVSNCQREHHGEMLKDIITPTLSCGFLRGSKRELWFQEPKKSMQSKKQASSATDSNSRPNSVIPRFHFQSEECHICAKEKGVISRPRKKWIDPISFNGKWSIDGESQSK